MDKKDNYEVLSKITEDYASITLNCLKPHRTLVLTQHTDDPKIICISSNIPLQEMRHIFSEILKKLPMKEKFPNQNKKNG